VLANVTSVDLGLMARIDALAMVLPTMKGAYVVDLGCGEGQVARALAARGAKVAGYDPFIASFVGEGKGGWTAEGEGHFRLALAGAEATPEADHCADLVLFVYSLHHVPQAKLEAALREARRLLKPTGRLCVVEPMAEGSAQYVMEPYHDETAVRRDAQIALSRYAAPMFASEKVFRFEERAVFRDFEAYAARAMLGARFNSYLAEAVTAPEVRRRFAEMAARNHGNFDQPVRINLFSGVRDAQ